MRSENGKIEEAEVLWGDFWEGTDCVKLMILLK